MPGEGYPGGFYPGGEIASGAFVPPPPPAPPEPQVISPATRQQEKLQPGRYMLRHIAPQATEAGSAGVIAPVGAGIGVLARTLFAESLPISRLPDSPDFHEGTYTLRMYDAGDFSLSFPNKDASDGRPWRERFATDGHVEWVEVSREGEIEHIGVVAKLTRDRQKVTISGYDGMWLLKKAFEQDFVTIMAPRDLIERYSQLWVVTLADTLKGGLGNWITTTEHAVLISDPKVGMAMGTEPGFASSFARAVSKNTASASGAWRMTCNVEFPTMPAASLFSISLTGPNSLTIEGPMTAEGRAILTGAHSVQAAIPLPASAQSAAQMSLTLESDGRWLRGFVNGVLVGYVPAIQESVAAAVIVLDATISKLAQTAYVTNFAWRTLTPFLMRGSEKGDYVLPGTANTYPTGGLHGRYRNFGSGSEGGAEWWHKLLAPDPRQPQFPDFIQTLDATIDTPEVPAGIAPENFAVQWFGAIYLDLAANAEIEVTLEGVDDGCRLWIGKTQWGQQIIDGWGPAAGTLSAKVKASVLGAKKGWFPIIIEYFEAFGPPRGIHFKIKAAVGWKAPNGEETIKSGIATVVPAIYLSPLGCVDARVQGGSHFDILLEQAKNFGFQLRCEPRQLESGEFPGRIVPVARLGRDTDEQIEADDVDRKSGANNYSSTLDATDSATSIRAFGSGIADGKGSQVAYETLSIPDENVDLFDMQAWLSAGDIAFPALLAARAASELGLRLGSWQNVEGEPFARERLADTFPLTGVLSQFRWQPGDGVRLWLPDVGVQDVAPRQILQVVRSFTAEGRTGTQIGFRSRPKDTAYVLRAAIREATRAPRSYQHQYVTRLGQYVEVEAAAGAWILYSIMPLSSGDKVVDARLQISLNTTAQPVEVEIGTINRTTVLGGPWTQPISLNVLPYAVPFSGTDQRLFARVRNAGGAASIIEYQLIVTLLV